MYSRKMLRLPLSEKNKKKIVKEALQVLRKGGIVAYPTESFYALGVMADNEGALKKLYSLKKRALEIPKPFLPIQPVPLMKGAC